MILKKFIGIITLFAIIGFSMTACEDDDNNNGDSTKYGSITFENLSTSFYAVSCSISDNPNYVFIGMDNFNSIGYGLKYVNDVISDYNKLILLGNGTPPDFTFTGKGSVQTVFNNGNETNNFVTVGFNNVNFSNGSATIDVNSSIPCLPISNSKFTLKNASEYNNKYAILIGAYGSIENEDFRSIFGFGNGAFKGAKIVNGEVILSLYEINMNNPNYQQLYIYGEPTAISILILDNEIFDYEDYIENAMSYKALTYLKNVNGISFTFNESPNSCKGEADATEGTKTGF